MKIISKISILFTALIFLSCQHFGIPASGKSTSEISALFEEIRGNEAILQYFFTQMPKGGDLHNHLTGSVYAETYFNIALRDGMWLNTDSYVLNLDAVCISCIRLNPGMENERYFRMRAIDHWSIRNFNAYNHTLPPDEFFFATFGKFGAITYQHLEEFLKELRLRARDENVQYLEIMVTGPRIDAGLVTRYETENNLLIALIERRNSPDFTKTLESLYQMWENDSSLQTEIENYINLIDELHAATAETAPEVTTYYQTYAGRNTKDPIAVFAQLYIGFKSGANNERLVGVNIVQPENGDYSLRDYWGHMQMFSFLKSRYGSAKTSMHAGELRLGLTPPENLQSNIHDAVVIAGANRIGHGVGIAFERNAPYLLRRMADSNIVVEINLTSNEFILGVKDSEHPIMLYHRKNVPLVLSTDDAGILRTNLSQQFVIAALRYPELKYEDFKNFALNSIKYSFMPEDVKEIELNKFIEQTEIFEKEIVKNLFR